MEIEECVSKVDTDQVDIVMKILDKDASGTLSYKEFLSTLPARVSDPIEGVRTEFLEKTKYQAPQQVHLSATTNPGEMVVMWVTRDRDASLVKYGKDSKSLTMTAKGTSATYNVGIDGKA